MSAGRLSPSRQKLHSLGNCEILLGTLDKKQGDTMITYLPMGRLP